MRHATADDSFIVSKLHTISDILNGNSVILAKINEYCSEINLNGILKSYQEIKTARIYKALQIKLLLIRCLCNVGP